MYIGNQPAQSFATVTSQTINGNGGATYTLNRAVNSAAELEVFVENVQQQPTVAYTASSTTLTFTANVPSATGNIYVIYRGLAQNVGQDENAPRLIGDNTLTGDQTITGDVTVGGTDLFVDTSAEKLGIGTATANQLHQKLNIYSSSEAGIQFMNDATGVANSTDGARISVYEDDIQYTNYESAGKQIFNVGTNGGTKAMEISSAGHILKPVQPAFHAGTATGSNTSGDGNGVGADFAGLERVSTNIGSHYATGNGRFTAPIAGTYFFHGQAISKATSTNSGAIEMNFRKNGGHIQDTFAYSNTGGLSKHTQLSIQATVTLAVNDYVNVRFAYEGAHGGGYSVFGGYLIG